MKIFNLEHEQQLSDCRKYVFAIITISLLIFSVYSNTFHASWHFDDEQNIVDNVKLHLTALSPEGLKETLFASPDGAGKMYRPIACLSFALNYYFGKTNVFGYHLVNILIHLLAAFFLFLFLYATLRLPILKPRYGSNGYFIALLSTVLWAVNPIQTQAITYIVQRMASMAAMFYIMAMYFYLKARVSRQPASKSGWFALCIISGIFSFGSKENAATLPFSIVLFDLFLIQGITRKNLKKSAVLLAILISIPLLLALIFEGPSFFTPSHMFSGYEHRGFTLAQRLLTEPRVIIYYISLLFYPMPNRLCITHVISPSNGLLHPPTSLLSILFILLILSAGLSQSKKRPLVSYCVLFFFLNHVIESTIFPLELIFEHRNYLPSMLFFVPVSILVIHGTRPIIAKASMRFTISAFVILVLIGFGHSTFVRNHIWRTEESLWLDAVDKNPDSVRAHHNLGRYYSNIGQSSRTISEYLTALRLKPESYGEKNYLTRYNLGLEYMAIGQNTKAKQEFQKAIDLFPKFADAYCNMAVIQTKEGDYERAYENLILSLTYNRNSPQAHNNLGYVLIKKGDYDNALSELQKALKLKKGYKSALRNMGIAYRYKKRFQKAISFFREAINNEPGDVLTRLHLAETYSLMGKPESANQVISRLMDSNGPRRVFERLKRLLEADSSFQELPKKSIIVPLLKRGYVEWGKSFEQMGHELSKFEYKD